MNAAPVLVSGLSRTVFPIGETRETVLNTPSKEALALPYYWTLPENHVDNIRWRLYVKERCLHDEGFRANIKYMCQQDVAFFVETFCVVFEPRPTPRMIPLKLWMDQVDVLAWADECYGRRDAGLEKSRGIGASWLFAIFLYHKWLFVPDTKIAISTKDETSLDGPDSNTLLGKIVYLHENMPAWMRMDAHGHDIMYRDKGSHVLHNKVNGATAQGFVSTNDKLRSLRFTCLAGGTQVLTDSGPCPIEQVTTEHKLWDGDNWVSHEGLVYKGEKETIAAYGVRLTADHKVLTTEGWQDAGKRLDRQAVRAPASYKAYRQEQNRREYVGLRMRLRGDSRADYRKYMAVPEHTRETWLWSKVCVQRRASKNSRPVRDKSVQRLGQHDKPVSSRTGGERLSKLRRAWHKRMQTMGQVRKLPRRHGSLPSGFDAGPDRQQRQLRTRQLSVGDAASTKSQPAKHKVYDLLNAGPRHRFTVVGDDGSLTIVHNCVLYDEFAFYTRDVQAQLNSSVHTSPNRFFISTWNGPDNAFHTIMRKEKSTLLRISMYWWNNSERYKGCYTSADGVLQILDDSYDYPPDYPFVLDGLKRSPWVDFELSRPGSSVQSAMEELYGLMAGDSRLLFQQRTRDIMSETVRSWVRECELYDGELVDEYEGRVKLLADNLDKRGPFSAGCDLSFGAGATYSTLEVIDLPTGEQVLEMAANDLPPIAFCQYVYGVLGWLNGDKGDGHTYLDFENNGNQGITFAEEIKRLGYGNVARRSYSKKGPSSKTAGEYLGTRNRDGGLFNLSEVERAILAGELRVRSELLRAELSAFVKDEDGKPLYPKGEDGHGDRAQGFGVAWANTRKKEFGKLKEDMERQKDPQAEIKGSLPSTKGRKSWAKSWSLRRSGWGL